MARHSTEIVGRLTVIIIVAIIATLIVWAMILADLKKKKYFRKKCCNLSGEIRRKLNVLTGYNKSAVKMLHTNKTPTKVDELDSYITKICEKIDTLSNCIEELIPILDKMSDTGHWFRKWDEDQQTYDKIKRKVWQIKLSPPPIVR